MSFDDNNIVNFLSDSALNAHLNQLSKRRTEKNYFMLRKMSQELMVHLGKQYISNAEFYNYITVAANQSRLE